MKQTITIGVVLLLFFIPATSIWAAPSGDGNVSDLFDDNDENQEAPADEETTDEEKPATESQEEPNEQLGSTDQSLFLDFLKMIVALVVVLGLIYFLLRFIQKRTRIYQQTRALENFGGLSLGSNKSVQIVRVGDEYYLIGVGDDVQLLDKIESKETIKNLQSSDSDTHQPLNFQDLLKKFSNRDKNPYADNEVKNSFQSEFNQMKSEREAILKHSRQKEGERHD